MKNKDLDPNIFNPLATDIPNNPWSNFFDDNKLKNEIKLDIDRTYADKEFFRRDETKEQMIQILFIWSKNHPSISYRQGMNEILAAIVFCFYSEKMSNPYTENSISQILKSYFML
jgi:TBC1 domain family member 5